MSSRVVQVCRDLVALPSVNPDGDPGTDHTGEKGCAEYAGEFCRRLGAKVTMEEVLPGRPNVIARFPSATAGKSRILLGPHTDTVSVAGMTIDPFGAELRDGRIYGRGACDTKGTMAAMLVALEELGDRIPELGAEITFAGFMGEETGQWGSRHFAKHHPDYHFGMVGEPTGCAVVNTHKGSWWLRLSTAGLAVHGSQPERGDNAVLKMLPVIEALDGPFRRLLAAPEFRHPVLGDSTINIGMIRGGTRTNIVPDSCTIWLDIRFTPAIHRAGLEKLLRDFLHEQGFIVTLEADPVCGPLETPASNLFVQKAAAAGQGLTGATWFCDALWLAEAGIPSVAAGPGDIAQAHTADEWVSVSQLEEGVGFYRRFLESL
ncbi:MAG TPA: M20 family metallopeptidase [Verrucomicrobiales bacterium]|nr:M20 family metallopeptidase [Verrucomicrobiales bacterium]